MLALPKRRLKKYLKCVSFLFQDCPLILSVMLGLFLICVIGVVGMSMQMTD